MTITQPRAPFHVVPRGWAGPGLLAMLLFDKYGQHQRLTRQAERFAREGVPLSLSTLADQVGAATFALMPLYRRIEAHVLAADRLHGDDTTCRSSPRARPISAGCGSMPATTGPSAAPIRPPRCSTIRATAVANILRCSRSHGFGATPRKLKAPDRARLRLQRRCNSTRMA